MDFSCFGENDRAVRDFEDKIREKYGYKRPSLGTRWKFRTTGGFDGVFCGE